MFVALPFKILVDSRASTTGTSESFQVSLPETLHLNPDIVMYVNSATCTNTILPTGTVAGAQRNTTYFLERKRNAATFLNRAILPEHLRRRRVGVCAAARATLLDEPCR